MYMSILILHIVTDLKIIINYKKKYYSAKKIGGSTFESIE